MPGLPVAVKVIRMTTVNIFDRVRGSRIALFGLGVGIVGLLIQWITDPAKFPSFPPGIIVIVVFGVLTALTNRWWWSPLLATAISLWIVGVGVAFLIDNLRSDNSGLVLGNIVMAIGLYGAAIAGIIGSVQRFRHRAEWANSRAAQ